MLRGCCHRAHVEVRGCLVEVVAFLCEGLRDQTPVIRLGRKHLYPQSCLAGPSKQYLPNIYYNPGSGIGILKLHFLKKKKKSRPRQEN